MPLHRTCLIASVSWLHQTGGVEEKQVAGRYAPNPDRLIKWFGGVVVIGVAVNVLSDWVHAQGWAWLPPAVFVAALLVAMPGGLLRRERLGATRWARGLALLSLAAYLAVAEWGWLTGWPSLVMILSAACLWGAGVLLIWSTLQSRRPLGVVAVGTSLFLLGSVGISFGGISLVRLFQPLYGLTFLLAGVATLLGGVAYLLNRPRLGGVALLLGGAAFWVLATTEFRDGARITGSGLVVVGFALLFGGIALLLNRPKLSGIGFLTLAIASIWVGVELLLDPLRTYMTYGIEFVLVGVAFMLMGVGLLGDRSALLGVGFLPLGVASLVAGVYWFVVPENALFGVGSLLFGLGSSLAGVASLYRPEFPQRVLAWLSQRDDATNTATEKDGD
jgi:hypothetical protein